MDPYETDIDSDGLQGGVVEREHEVPRVPKGHLRRPGMSGFDGTDMREPCRVQYFMELIVIEARGIEPVAVERFVVGESELHCCAARQLDHDYFSDVGRS